MLKPLVIDFCQCTKYSRYAKCNNGSLNAYLDKCLNIIFSFVEFVIRHILKEDNEQANALAQQASGYTIVKKYFHIQKPMQAKAELQVLDELVRPVDSIGLIAQTGLTGHETGLIAQAAQTTGDTNSAMEDDSITKAVHQDWMVPIISCLKILVAVQRGIFSVWHSNMFFNG